MPSVVNAPAIRTRRPRAIAAFIAFVIVACFHGFTVWTSGDVGDDAPFDYYNLLVDGFRAGHLYLAKAPDPALVRLADPYDPARNANVRLGDASYYRGHYYLYFGVTPAVTLLLPYHLVTGRHLPQAVGVGVFVVLGLAAASVLIVRVTSRVSGAPSWIAPAGILVVGLGAHLLALTRRPEVWEFPIAAEFAFTMWGLLAAAVSIEASRPVRWIGSAAFCLGAAVGARPTAILTAGSLAIAIGVVVARQGRVRGVQAFVTAASILAVIAAALAWYNVARFGSPWQFGQAYQLTSLREGSVTHFSSAYAWHNLRVYFAWPVHWTRHFPFLASRALPPAPVGYYGGEELYCLAVLAPFLWWDAGAAQLWRRAGDVWLPCVAAMVVATAAPPLLLLLCFFSATERYMAEFVPALMVLAVIGAAVTLSRVSAAWRRIVSILVAASAVVTVGMGVLASFDYHGQSMRRTAPAAWRRVATFANAPVETVARWLDGSATSRGGLLRIRVNELDRIPVNDAAPLLVLGHAPTADVIGLRRLGPARWQVFHDHWGAPVHDGPELTLAPNQSHVVTILVPSCDKENFGTPVAGNVTVRVDDRVVFDVWSDTYGLAPEEVAIGKNTVGATTCGATFPGRIAEVRWQR